MNCSKSADYFKQASCDQDVLQRYPPQIFLIRMDEAQTVIRRIKCLWLRR